MTYPTFKTITLGTKTAKEYIEAIEKDFKLGSYAKQILESKGFSVSKKKISVDLVSPSVADLGFTKDTPLREIYARANELGLDLCPPEVGLELRMEYRNQPMDEWIAIAMEPLPDAGGSLSVFRVERGGGGLWLDTFWSALGSTWGPEARFVFVRRKQSLTAGSLSGLENPSESLALEFKNKEEMEFWKEVYMCNGKDVKIADALVLALRERSKKLKK